MKTSLKLMLLLLAVSDVHAQTSKTGEAAITSGAGNEYNASFASQIDHNLSEWLVFERLTADSSFIVGKLFRRNTGCWDSSETVISGAAAADSQKYPAIASKEKTSMALWQQKKGSYWNIAYSLYSDSLKRWSAPQSLTRDTLNNANVRVQALYPDSQFVIAWQNKNAVRIRRYPLVPQTISDTIACSNDESAEFDLGAEGGFLRGAVAYTIKAAGNVRKAVVREFNFYSPPSYGIPDTLNLNNLSAYQPRFHQPYTSLQWISFHSARSEFQDIYLYSGNVLFDPPLRQVTSSANTHVSYRNARASYNPVVTVQGLAGSPRWTPFNHVAAFECTDDSSIYSQPGKTDLIILEYRSTDSITSNGKNCNPAIGATPFNLSAEPNVYVPVVWESNRTGKNHLYWKNALQNVLTTVPVRRRTVEKISLADNYPNPFNPTTIIGYQLPISAFVTLTVFDILGREAATLVNGKKEPGTHSVVWDASRMSAGIYFYSLKVGDFTQTKRLVVIK